MWIITEDEKDQHFVNAINRILENVESLRGSAMKAEDGNVEEPYTKILKDLRLLKVYK
ncbi:hypothetical protein [Priestia filamentosa]|uniref:hypothetical protein n=1 Tax=Priestia filamentosa TaxID=1402861 RepID=UPI000A087B47|nr:hypothetical protein [Priestia filamentosa]SMF75076.1 hypothetical protein SAMN06296056_11717 [Priestia filamentosa]